MRGQAVNIKFENGRYWLEKYIEKGKPWMIPAMKRNPFEDFLYFAADSTAPWTIKNPEQ